MDGTQGGADGKKKGKKREDLTAQAYCKRGGAM